MSVEHFDRAPNSLLYCVAFLCFCGGVFLLGFLGIEAASYADRSRQCTSSIRSDELPQPVQAALTPFERQLLEK